MGNVEADHYADEANYWNYDEVYEMIRPFSCDRCDRIFVEEARLMWHRKNIHLINDDEE